MHNTPTTSTTTYARYLRRQGVRATTSPDRAAHHIALLRRAGMRDPQIAAAAHRSAATLYRIAKRHTPTISRATEAAILAVPVPAQPTPLTGRAATTHSHGTARRLQALVVAGNPPAVLAALLGVGRGHFADLLHQRYPRTSIHVASRVEALYLERWNKPAENHDVPPFAAAEARALASRHGWAPAAAWDDIDHPNTRPDLGGETSRQQAVIQDTAELAAQGYSREGIACRLGIGWDAVRQAHRRAGVRLPTLLDD